MDKSQEILYATETNKIINTIGKMGLDDAQQKHAEHLVKDFRNAFKSKDVRRMTFPDEELTPQVAVRMWHSDGFCRASSIAFCTLMGGEENGWRLMAIPDMFAPYGPHYYILHTPSNTILDLTADQFTHYSSLQDIPYKCGKPAFDKVVEHDSPANFAATLGINLVKESKKQKTLYMKNAKTGTGR
ncbi:MAG: hypothetical protein J5679_01440 [Alphaproteobacteria bacterium]|nr:hypothetical protein [Alphaproteobacteria bacterium]